MRAIFLFLKIGNESVNHADSGDIKIFVQFPENSILKFSKNFWNRVDGTNLRGRFWVKMPENVFNYISHKLSKSNLQVYLILAQPT